MIKGILLVLFGVWLGGFGGFNVLASKFFSPYEQQIKEIYKNIFNNVNIIEEDFSEEESKEFSNHDEDSWNKEENSNESSYKSFEIMKDEDIELDLNKGVSSQDIKSFEEKYLKK